MQFTPPSTFSRTLDAEFKRVAEHENKPMEELTDEVSQLVNRKPREIYNWRSGKWAIPSNLIPILCRRFRSSVLVKALVAECHDVVTVIPEGADLPRLVARSMKDDLALCEKFLDAYLSDGVQPHELRELREVAERVVSQTYQLVEVAAADCERRSAGRRTIQRSSTDHSKDHALVSTDRGERR